MSEPSHTRLKENQTKTSSLFLNLISAFYHYRRLATWGENRTARAMNPQGERISLSELDAG